MAGNSSLRKANAIKEDEFYTQLSDIECELKHYKKHFKDKIVFCNCDDPYESNFFKYFALNFNYLGLKKLIATCYDGSPIQSKQISLFDVNTVKKPVDKKAYKIEITEVDDYNGDGAVDLSDVEYLIKNKNNVLTMLEGNGDFRSKECVDILQEADIVVTNPPFSIAREYYIPLLNDNNKNFLIVGDLNWITYKGIFPLLKENKMWLGYNSIKEFVKPDGSIKKFGNKLWYTNLDIKKRHEDVLLWKKYNESSYSKFDNYKAINVNKISDIPEDYYDVMAVPITFMNKYNPEQFEIVDALNRYSLLDVQNTNETVRNNHSHTCNIDGKPTYFRIVIRRKV